MTRTKTFQRLFRRHRRPGDFVISALSFAFAAVLLLCLPFQTDWVAGTRLFAQPAFWPAVSVIAMVLFSGLHLLGAVVSEPRPGRVEEVIQWLKALEYLAWFMAYVGLVPILGYLPASIAFCVALTLRLGYRGWRWMLAATLFATGVVLLFKGLLAVRIPSGLVYDILPSGPLRTFVMTYL